jgi:hypothetical protein
MQSMSVQEAVEIFVHTISRFAKMNFGGFSDEIQNITGGKVSIEVSDFTLLHFTAALLAIDAQSVNNIYDKIISTRIHCEIEKFSQVYFDTLETQQEYLCYFNEWNRGIDDPCCTPWDRVSGRLLGNILSTEALVENSFKISDGSIYISPTLLLVVSDVLARRFIFWKRFSSEVIVR